MAKPSRKKSVRSSGSPGMATARDPLVEIGTSQGDRTDRRNVLLVALVAIVVRTLFFLLNRHNNPLFDNPIMDGLYHHEWALRIVGGDFWGDEVFFRAPLYPYFLALLYKLSGSSIAFALACQHVLGAMSAVLVYFLAREYFVHAVALVAGFAAALYWPFIYFEGDLLIVTLIITLDLAALLLAARALRKDRTFVFAAAGFVFGLSAVARPSILVVLFFLPVVVYARDRAMRPVLRRSVWLFAGAVVAIAPVLVRNYLVGHDFVPVASQGGVNFYIGNNPESDGRTAIVPGTRWDWWGGYHDAILQAETEAGRALKPSEVSNHYFAKGLGFVFGSPARSVPLLAHKLALFWAGGERSNNKYIYFFWHQSGMGRVPLPGFWLIAPLGLAGGVLLWRRRRELSLLYLFVLTYMAGVVAFFVNARFRLPVVPVVIIFAAYVACHFVTQLKQHSTGRLKVAVLLACCFIVVDSDFLRFRENKVHADSISHYTLGNAYLKDNRTGPAMEEYEKALDVYRRYPTPGFQLVERNVKYNLGRLYAARGHCARAIPLLESVGGTDEYTILAMELSGDCYASLNRFVDAFRVYAQILRTAPGHPEASSKLVDVAIRQSRMYVSNGDRASASAILQQTLAILPGNAVVTQALEALP